MKLRPTNRKKFSLIEILIVMAIVILLMALTISSYKDMRFRVKLLQAKEQIFAIKMGVINFRKDLNHFPDVGSSATETIRPFKQIREELLGDNPYGAVYINGDGANIFFTGAGNSGNINTQAYKHHQYMIAFDYNGSGVIGDNGQVGKPNLNTFKSHSHPDITLEDASRDVMIWMKHPIEGEPDLRSW